MGENSNPMRITKKQIKFETQKRKNNNKKPSEQRKPIGERNANELAAGT